MASVDPIKVEGLRDFQAALKHMDGESQKKIRLVLNAVAEGIATSAARKVPRDSGRAAGSYKVASGQREAKVKAGGSKAPYLPWLEFGGAVGKKKSVKRTVKHHGRYLYPTFFQSRQSTLKAMEEGLAQLARDAGLEVTNG